MQIYDFLILLSKACVLDRKLFIFNYFTTNTKNIIRHFVGTHAVVVVIMTIIIIVIVIIVNVRNFTPEADGNVMNP